MNQYKNIKINRDFLFRENFSPHSSEREISHIVLHHVGSSDLNNVGASIDIFKKYGVSSHYIISQTGLIYQLVDENNIAFHAGVSYWNGVNELNNTSIGIEFHSPSPENTGFTKEQVKSGIKLCQNIIEKYRVKQRNVLGHSDIAYNKSDGNLDRKQDPSHLFLWKTFARYGVGIYPNTRVSNKDNNIICKLEDEGKIVLNIQDMLKQFGYRIEIDGFYGRQTESVIKVFKRRFENQFFNEGSGKIFYYSTYRKLKLLCSLL